MSDRVTLFPMVKITFAKQHYIGIRARYGGNRFVMAKIISRSKISWRKSIFYGENYSAAGRRFVMEIIFWRLLDVAWPRGGVGRVRREPTARVRAPYGAARLPDNGSVARSRL